MGKPINFRIHLPGIKSQLCHLQAKYLNFSASQFPHLWRDCSYLIGLCCRWSELIHIKSLEQCPKMPSCQSLTASQSILGPDIRIKKPREVLWFSQGHTIKKRKIVWLLVLVLPKCSITFLNYFQSSSTLKKQNKTLSFIHSANKLYSCWQKIHLSFHGKWVITSSPEILCLVAVFHSAQENSKMLMG